MSAPGDVCWSGIGSSEKIDWQHWTVQSVPKKKLIVSLGKQDPTIILDDDTKIPLSFFLLFLTKIFGLKAEHRSGNQDDLFDFYLK